jgi:hypothetical protein
LVISLFYKFFVRFFCEVTRTTSAHIELGAA